MIVSIGLTTLIAFSSGAGTYPVDAASNYKTIMIKKGDTLYALAIKYKTTVSKLKSLNKLKSSSIYAGEKLKVPSTQSYKTAKQYYAELEKNKSYTPDQKTMIKRSKLIDYVVSTYKEKMDITGYITENADLQDEDPAMVTIELTERSTKLIYTVAKELVGGEDEHVYDNYMLNVISYETRKMVEPSIQNIFKKKKVEYFTRVYIQSATHKKLTQKKLEWEYKNVKNDSSTVVFLMIPDTKEYHELAITYIQTQNKSSKIKVNDYDLYFYSGKNNAKLRNISVNEYQIGKFNTVEKLVSKLESASPMQYKDNTRSLVKQTKIYK